ncbi:MAG: hypothetical protein ASARMPREDX12_001594 [Alectoria sarmentosa]|nr:MAG: hypothetical protein ASARMPREDX12_001594 [Alectoria sarmentosa]
MQHIPKSLVTTPKLEKRLATVKGVINTSKISQGGELHKKEPWTVKRAGRETKTTMTCSICSSTCRDLRELRGHFVVCVDRNGNPDGARWDDCLTPDDAANLRSNPRYAAIRGSTARDALSSEDIAELKERNRNAKERLAAVNGIVIPSKLSAGQLPSQGTFERNERQKNPCIICGRKFVEKRQVRAHSVTCVKRNGNPTGARWDDALKSAASPAGPMKLQMEDSWPEDYRFEDIESGGLGMDSLLSDRFNKLNPQPASATLQGLQPSLPYIQQINPQIAAPPFSGVPSYNAHLNTPNLQPIPSSSNGMEPYDPHLRLDLLTNQALLSMVQAWQEVIYCGEERYTLEHPHFQDLMKELVKRDMVSVSWKWTVDIAEVDMALTRAMVEGLGGFIRSSAGESDIFL